MPQVTRRQILSLASASVALAGMHRVRAGETPDKPWFRRFLVGIEIGPTGANDHDSIYMSQASGEKWIDALVRSHSEYGVVFMKDQNFAYYNSEIVRKCPNLRSRDLLRECIESATPYKIPIVAYCQIQYDSGAWLKNSDWRMKDRHGADIPDRLCFNSPYLEYNCRVAEEMLRYGIAGFHFDMLDYGFSEPIGCWCSHCQNSFRKQFGHEIPLEISWDEDWDRVLQFRYQSNARFCEQLAAFVKSKNSAASVDFNYHGYPPFSWLSAERPVQHAANGDFVTAEGLPWIFGNYNPSLLALFLKGTRPDAPVQCVTSRSVYNYHDFSLRPRADMAWEVATYMAHGSQCTIVDKANYEGSLDTLVYDRIGSIFADVKRKSDYFGHQPIQEVGLYYSSRSRDWFGRDDPEKYMAAFTGAHKALVEAHIPLGIVTDENVSSQLLRRFPVVYLPNAAVVTEPEVAMLEKYVRDGGRLLLTGLTGIYDRFGQPQTDSAFTKMLGARLVEAHTEWPDNYLRLPSGLSEGAGKFLLQDMPTNWPILTWGPVAAYRPDGAQAFGDLMTAHRTQDNSWSKHMSPAKCIGPAILINSFGKGTVILVPCLPDAAFLQRYRMTEHRNLLRNLIRYLAPNPEVTIEAPANVEVVPTTDDVGKRLIVHLVAYSAPPTAAAPAFGRGREVLPPVMEEPSIYEVTVRLRQHFKSASTVSRKTSLDRQANQLRLQIRDIHEILIVRL